MKIIGFILVLLFQVGSVFALDQRPSLYLEPDREVQNDKIYLGEIAIIRGNETEYAKLIGDLRGIELGESPRPLSSKIFRGEDILAAIDARGIPREAFGYSIPKQITVKRAGRLLTNQEVVESVKSKINTNPDLDLQVKSISWDTDQVLPLGAARIESEILGTPARGKLPLRISVMIDDAVSSRFLATALVDDWKSIPVLKTRLERGMLINPSDIQIVRTNMAGLPPDVALKPEDITGKRVTKSVGFGEPLRRADIDIPPVVEKGKVLKMKFQSGGFVAVATGVALQSGQLEDLIELRNERSNKVVKGKIVSQDEVVIN